MSLLLRMAALVLFVAILIGGTPVSAYWDCDFQCSTVGGLPPFYTIECYDMMCIDVPSCETNCIVTGCTDYEAGALIGLQC